MKIRGLLFWCCLILTINLKAHQQANLTKVICIITAVQIGKQNVSIKADYVQMLTGNAAIVAAKRAGEAEFESGTWYVPNDYYVLNQSNKLRNLCLAKNVSIYMVKEGTAALSQATLAKLKKSFGDKLFKLYIHKEQVIKVEQIYIP